MYLQENRKAKPIRKCKYSPSSAGMIRAKAAQPSTVQNIAFPPFMSAKGKKADIKRTEQKYTDPRELLRRFQLCSRSTSAPILKSFFYRFP